MQTIEIPFWAAFTTYFSYGVLFVFGHLRDFYRRFFPVDKGTKPGYAPFTFDWDDFYTRRLYWRIRDAWNRPISSRPAAVFTVVERTTKDQGKTLEYTGNAAECVNLASYNYLGFAENPPQVQEDVLDCVDTYGLSMCSAPCEVGQSQAVQKLEVAIAEFVGKEAAMVFGMGFATNQCGLPGFLSDPNCLIISDHLNHSSIVQGCRGCKATIKVFRHNDYAMLETVVRKSIVYGNPNRCRPYSKIIVIVEGVYSMEGEILNLPKVVELKKRYNFYLYVDEAHSIGALGPHGKGVCDHWGVSPDDVDVLMGTFTKSFGSAGGYIASSKEFIASLRSLSPAYLYGCSMSPIIAQQALSAIHWITKTEEGKERIRRLHENSTYFRQRLIKDGFQVLGDDTSPVVPVLLYHPAKIPAFSRECLSRGVAVVVVGYPASPLVESRVRFCISAAHTKQQLDFSLDVIKEVGDVCCNRYMLYEEKMPGWIKSLLNSQSKSAQAAVNGKAKPLNGHSKTNGHAKKKQ
eukprot:TRINITY_DN61290_c0_g1_i2.p1 TRINITY_DN61290_c0_g1~~TRINITY_DN61290_c0_g1_i2.p1  ORF type:complete len:518 (-),score=37.46 TRINITY_DN61290_c0_g1_i2:284-1837(-)